MPVNDFSPDLINSWDIYMQTWDEGQFMNNALTFSF